jgi:serine/threonine-protein kinase
MAPEQLQGGRGFASSDIYAVGVMLYEMLCGRVPFEGESVFAVLNQHVTQDPPSVRQFNPLVSPALETVVMHAIRRDPDKRYKTMRAMLDDLTHLESVTPVPYKPAPPQMDNTKRQIILGLLITGAILVVLVAIGVLAQVLHNVVR